MESGSKESFFPKTITDHNLFNPSTTVVHTQPQLNSTLSVVQQPLSINTIGSCSERKYTRVIEKMVIWD